MILVTGGAGFIGRYVVRMLVERGESVRVADALLPQVHGRPHVMYDDLRHVDFHVADLTVSHLPPLLEDVDTVVHLAAEVGVGQSQYAITRYVQANCVGTARLLEAIRERGKQVKRLVVASSMSIYGEGARNGRGEPIPTSEKHPLTPASIYAVTKRDQEELCLTFGAAYRIPTAALRFFNTYGEGQALSNPYTGAIAIFASQLLNGNPPQVFEDGKQTRDFIHVSDVAAAVVRAVDCQADGAFNVGTGQAVSVLDVADALATLLDGPIPQVTNTKRIGDIRHCIADVTKIKTAMGWAPTVGLLDGLAAVADFLRTQHAEDHTARATAELQAAGLLG